MSSEREVEARWQVLFVDNPQGIARGELRVPVPLSLSQPERLELVVEHAYIAECNDAYARIYGWPSARDVVGKSLPELMGMDEHQVAAMLLGTLGASIVKPNWERRVRRRDGSWRWLFGNTIPFVADGCLRHWWATVNDITEHKRQESLLAQLASATTGTGEELFEGLVQRLGEALEVDAVYVAALGEGGVARSIAAWRDGALAEPFEISLGGTPEARVAAGEEVVLAKDARLHFPNDARLRALAIESFFGVPLLGSGDAPDGLLVAMHRGPMNEAPPADAMRIVAARAAAELARMRAEVSLQAAQARLEAALGRSERRVVQLEEQVGEPAGASEIGTMVGHSPAMRHVHRRLRLVAQSDVTVLVTGETGTGKELAASAIHALSPRASGPFVALSCVELPETLLESELFGHVKGAFTGAVKDKVGLFQAAKGGTLFLDEIGELSPVVQAKLLRVLQERQVRRVGDHRPVPVDVRLVCATHRDLRALIRAGSFREDLFFRIQVFELKLPPLTERRGDIPLLIARFIDELALRHGKALRGIDTQALELLQTHSWPGNVRELRNAIEHAVVTATRDHLRAEDLPPLIDARGGAPSLLPADPELEAKIRAALDASGGHRENAAKALGMSRVTLWKKMKALGLAD